MNRESRQRSQRSKGVFRSQEGKATQKETGEKVRESKTGEKREAKRKTPDARVCQKEIEPPYLLQSQLEHQGVPSLTRGISRVPA